MKKIKGDIFNTDTGVLIMLIRTQLNEVIDAVNELQERVEANTPQEEANDTHRTVTLRIPKGKRIGQAISNAAQGDPLYISDTDLQKALDEVKPNE